MHVADERDSPGYVEARSPPGTSVKCPSFACFADSRHPGRAGRLNASRHLVGGRQHLSEASGGQGFFLATTITLAEGNVHKGLAVMLPRASLRASHDFLLRAGLIRSTTVVRGRPLNPLPREATVTASLYSTAAGGGVRVVAQASASSSERGPRGHDALHLPSLTPYRKRFGTRGARYATPATRRRRSLRAATRSGTCLGPFAANCQPLVSSASVSRIAAASTPRSSTAAGSAQRASETFPA